MEAVRQLGTVLGVWAHPDDETYLSGGVLAATGRNGQRVACVTATAGERGTADPARWPPQRLASLRRGELARALELLGVEEHRWLGYADGGCASIPHETAVARLVAILEEVRPDTILTFGSDGVTGHPDHLAVGRWARDAAARTGWEPRVLAAAKETGWVEDFADLHDRFDVFQPGYPVPVARETLALHLELPDELLDVKVAALRAQRSQTAPLIEAVGLRSWREWIRAESFTDVTATPAAEPGGHTPAAP